MPSTSEPTSPFREDTTSEAAPEASHFRDADTHVSSLECSAETSMTQISTIPNDLSAVDEPPTQTVMTAFPYTESARENRCFSAKRYDEVTWPEYSSTNNAVFCKACLHFPNPCTEKVFICDGFKDGKHLCRSCIRHQASKSHSLYLSTY